MPDLSGKQYNAVVALVGFSSDLGSRLSDVEETVAEYVLTNPPFDDLDFVDAIKHLDANAVQVWVNAYSAMVATPEFSAFRAAMRQAAP